MSFWSYLIVPFAWLMQFCMKLVNDYALAMILYALITKIIIFPFAIKQQKSSMAMLRLKPYQDALAKKYGSNKERYSMELQKLYQREGYNPMGSCLPMLIQLPLIFLIYSIVRHPITYVHYNAFFTADTAQQIFDKVQAFGFDKFPDKIAKAFEKIASGDAAVTTISNYELQIYDKMSDVFSIAGDKLFGFIPLSGTPNTDFWSWMLLIPIFSGITSFLLSWLSQKFGPMQQAQDPSAAGSNKMMMYMMPIMSVYFCYTLNCALGLYWIIGNVLGIAQIFVLNKIYDPKKVLAEVEVKLEEEKEKKREKRHAAAEKKAAAIAASKNSKKK